MKLIIEQSALNRALNRVVGVVAARNTIAVLSNVGIDADGDDIWLTATDLNMEARARVEGTVVEPGAITAPAGLLSGLVGSAPSGSQVSLTHGPGDPRLKLEFGRSRYNVPVLARDLLPTLPKQESPTLVTVPAVELALILSRTAYSQCTDKGRDHLKGLYLHRLDDGRLRVVATDTHRLALADTPPVKDGEAMVGVIIPAKAVSEFSRALSSFSGPVQLSVSRQAVVLDLGFATVRTKTIEGDYIDYNRVVPSTWGAAPVVDRSLMLETAKRILQVSDRKDHSIRLSFATGALTMSAATIDTGQGVEEIEVDYAGDEMVVGFNGRYLIEALNQTSAERLVFRLSSGIGPCRVEPSVDDAEHGPVVSILMPQVTT